MSLKANVGDLIQYRYLSGTFLHHNTRRVERLHPSGYWVDGGYFVEKKNVLTVIPMHEEPDQLKTENSKLETARSADFPLEANQ
jgi:hypothetical protein